LEQNYNQRCEDKANRATEWHEPAQRFEKTVIVRLAQLLTAQIY
jgi:hypothetical protein